MTDTANSSPAVPTGLTLLDRIVRNDSAVSAEVDGEVVALDAVKGACYGLNGTGSRVWQLIETPASAAEICATLLSEFNVDEEVCERDVLDLLDALRSEGLVKLAPAGAATTPGS